MVISSRLNTKILLFMVVFLSIQCSLVYTADQSIAAETVVASLPDDDVVLKEFKETYTRIKSNISKGKLEQESGDNADLLAIELKKHLINAQAQKEILKIDILSEVKQKQIDAVDKLIELSAAGERFKLSQLSQLKLLEGTSKTSETISQTTTKNLDFEIEIKPEDITQGIHD